MGDINIEKYIFNYKKITQTGLRNFTYIKKSFNSKNGKSKGLGVFADKFFKKDDIVEFCHSITLDWRGKYVKDQSLIRYGVWHECECDICKTHGKNGLIALGNGSIINCPDAKEYANVEYITSPENNLVLFYAIKDIQKDEEILSWHGQDYYDFWCKDYQ
jgi:hypothetical protein